MRRESVDFFETSDIIGTCERPGKLFSRSGRSIKEYNANRYERFTKRRDTMPSKKTAPETEKTVEIEKKTVDTEKAKKPAAKKTAAKKTSAKKADVK